MEERGDYIITIDDDPMMQKLIEKSTGKRSLLFTSLSEFEKQMPTLNPIALFVDVHLGTHENGLDILPKLKNKWPFAPIIVMTGDKQEDSVGDALAAGADDFINKPLNSKEVVARLQARLGELAKREAREVIEIGDIVIDKAHRVISNDNKAHRYLSPTELSLLTCLLDAKGTVVRREIMKRKCWGQIYVSDNALNRKLHEVRRALKEISNNVTIRTLYGTGFVLEVKENQETYYHKNAS